MRVNNTKQTWPFQSSLDISFKWTDVNKRQQSNIQAWPFQSSLNLCLNESIHRCSIQTQKSKYPSIYENL